MMNRIVTLAATVAFAALSAVAAPNLSGEWKLNAAKSDFGPVPAPDKMIRKIMHADPSLKMTTMQSGAQGEVTSELAYTTDGKETVNKSARGEVKGTAKWSGENLIIDSKREFQGAEITQHETWSLGDDGKTLTVLNKITAPQGEFDLKMVFEKQ
ncbi:MAG: hypothetical protein ABI823_21510 [Bryobacteraceae bacterium]